MQQYGFYLLKNCNDYDMKRLKKLLLKAALIVNNPTVSGIYPMNRQNFLKLNYQLNNFYIKNKGTAALLNKKINSYSTAKLISNFLNSKLLSEKKKINMLLSYFPKKFITRYSKTRQLILKKIKEIENDINKGYKTKYLSKQRNFKKLCKFLVAKKKYRIFFDNQFGGIFLKNKRIFNKNSHSKFNLRLPSKQKIKSLNRNKGKKSNSLKLNQRYVLKKNDQKNYKKPLNFKWSQAHLQNKKQHRKNNRIWNSKFNQRHILKVRDRNQSHLKFNRKGKWKSKRFDKLYKRRIKKQARLRIRGLIVKKLARRNRKLRLFMKYLKIKKKLPKKGHLIGFNHLRSSTRKFLRYKFKYAKYVVPKFKKIYLRGIKLSFSGRTRRRNMMARTEWYKKGPLPSQLIEANIDYYQSVAQTKLGSIGIKVWLYLVTTKDFY
eukprot:GEZU01026109.1.p1 GENE.GEZU01026109.1~~GEZU01026109.1.p1  ORF type:complete len:463 (+),score=-148.78 GEZU01026109.1:92-1390(+)